MSPSQVGSWWIPSHVLHKYQHQNRNIKSMKWRKKQRQKTLCCLPVRGVDWKIWQTTQKDTQAVATLPWLILSEENQPPKWQQIAMWRKFPILDRPHHTTQLACNYVVKSINPPRTENRASECLTLHVDTRALCSCPSWVRTIIFPGSHIRVKIFRPIVRCHLDRLFLISSLYW